MVIVRKLRDAAMALALAIPLHALAVPPGVGSLVAEALELAAKRSGRVVAGPAEREAAEATLEASIAKYGRGAVTAAGDGGLELVEAARAYGPEVMEYATKVSAPARRVLALKAEKLLPLARAVGPEALELEAKAPGMAQRVVDAFGADGARTVAAKVAAEDIPRLLMYAEKATTPRAKKLLLARYLEEGPGLFKRVRPAAVLAGGLTEAMLLGGLAMIAARVLPYVAPALWGLAALVAAASLVLWLRRRRAAPTA